MEAELSVEAMQELDEKREWANAEAEKHRRRRDELNMGTREWVERRDALNAEVRALVDQATQHRQRRDELNAKVQEAKAERDTLNRRVNELNGGLMDLKRTKSPRGGVSLSRLKRDVRNLEFKQQTSVLSAGDERAIIEEMGRLQAEIRKREKELEKDEEIAKAIGGLHAAKDAAEAAHKLVGDVAEEAQKEHDAMVALFEQSDEIRRQADGAQEEFIKTKMAADEEHRKHIEFIRQVHDYDKIIHGIRSRGRPGVVEEAGDVKREAEVIYEKFRKGEKLSTEDLMTLQKSGYM